MISLALVLSFINLGFLVAGIIFILRLYLNPKDDPRLGRGLQILQSKISVVEDLSRQVDKQSEQVISLLEHKIKEIQEKIFTLQTEEEKLSQKQSELKSIIRLFQDRIPFEEIAQRKMTVKYVRAAKLAHQGKSVEEIAKIVDLPRSELLMISKMNREQLVFAEESLPEWVSESNESKSELDQQEETAEDMVTQDKVQHALADEPSVSSDRVEFEPQNLVGFQDAHLAKSTAFIEEPTANKESEPILVMPDQAKSSQGLKDQTKDQSIKSLQKATVVEENRPSEPAFSLKGDLIQVQKVQFPRLDLTLHSRE